MAVIVEDTRLTIATRLANLNYKEKLDALREKLNEAIEKRFIEKTPEDVLACFKAHKEFFLRCNEATLSPITCRRDGSRKIGEAVLSTFA